MHEIISNFFVSSLFMLVYQFLKFQDGVLKPSDLPWNTPYTYQYPGVSIGMEQLPSESELFRALPNNFINPVSCQPVKNLSDSNWVNNTSYELLIICNPNEYMVRIICIDTDWKFCFDQSENGLILIGLDGKLFSYSFGLNQMESDWFSIFLRQRKLIKFFGLAENSSDSLGLNSIPILSPGQSSFLYAHENS